MSTASITAATSSANTTRESIAINPSYTFNFRWKTLQTQSPSLAAIHEATYITAIAILLPQTQVELKDGFYELLFTLSDQPLSTATTAQTSEPTSTKPSIGDSLLERLYNDTTNQDVLFVFSNVVEGAENATTGENFDDEKPDTTSGGQAPPLTVDTASVGTESTLGAHRLVLSQWPYFKTMFEGGFVESSPGEKRILIKDVNMQTFKLLLRFMYTGTLPLDAEPKTMYKSFMTKQEASWEQVFTAAHRYNISELCRWAQEKILAGLTSFMSVDFLFRTGYLYDELRRPVIKYIAKNCGTHIATKTIRDRYKDHPDIVDILGEVFEQYFSLHK
ncbi:hypothetical protein BGZ74_006512 [Mortierella antarctica]|nr:hypothetical protein BGZ74_006512 [Mortierella antarctica]